MTLDVMLFWFRDETMVERRQTSHRRSMRQTLAPPMYSREKVAYPAGQIAPATMPALDRSK